MECWIKKFQKLEIYEIFLEVCVLVNPVFLCHQQFVKLNVFKYN